jgi:hypothetical protein
LILVYKNKSSTAAVFTDPEALGKGVAYTEHDWNTGATAEELPYMFSKTAAEAAAHRAAADQAAPGRWRLVSINPGAHALCSRSRSSSPLTACS